MTSDEQMQSPASWREIVAAQGKLFEGQMAESAADYRRLLESTKFAPLNRLLPTLRQLKRVKGSIGKARSKIRILDHEYGGGAPLLYLAALEYADVHGVDIGGHMEKIARTVRAMSESDEARVRVYDGFTLPFFDRSADLIFSQQLKDLFIGFSTDEEDLIPNDKGIAYHQIPHCWTPWKSQTKTCFNHYFARFLRRRAYRLFGNDPDYLDEMARLSSPMYFQRKFGSAFLDFQNETMGRTALWPDLSNYGGNIHLRSLITKLAILPIIRNLIIYFVMIDVTASQSIASR